MARKTTTMDETHKQVCVAFGKALRGARKGKGMSQQRLADDTCTDRTYLSMLERGLQQPTLLMLIKIAKGLSLEPQQLVDTFMGHLQEAQEA